MKLGTYQRGGEGSKSVTRRKSSDLFVDFLTFGCMLIFHFGKELNNWISSLVRVICCCGLLTPASFPLCPICLRRTFFGSWPHPWPPGQVTPGARAPDLPGQGRVPARLLTPVRPAAAGGRHRHHAGKACARRKPTGNRTVTEAPKLQPRDHALPEIYLRAFPKPEPIRTLSYVRLIVSILSVSTDLWPAVTPRNDCQLAYLPGRGTPTLRIWFPAIHTPNKPGTGG